MRRPVSLPTSEFALATALFRVQGVVAGGADAVLAASIFHFRESTVDQGRDYRRERGVPVRE